MSTYDETSHLEFLITLVQVHAGDLPGLQGVDRGQHPVLKLVHLALKAVELVAHALEHVAVPRGGVADLVVAGVEGVQLGLECLGHLGLAGLDELSGRLIDGVDARLMADDVIFHRLLERKKKRNKIGFNVFEFCPSCICFRNNTW